MQRKLLTNEQIENIYNNIITFFKKIYKMLAILLANSLLL
ncbi:hypothetical protein CAXC1_30018 [Candidatus Xenohaliotis californiensis]|uniref:Uncharacterized protein n=1 Tax=Candidatus Xenohaliotis californiensis TaxID=84677 RepID=A0ABM9N922_9RICK|nr:hypothetical protein CAXC1_30018 [Candidatus Xenohaliotis californiensis]